MSAHNSPNNAADSLPAISASEQGIHYYLRPLDHHLATDAEGSFPPLPIGEASDSSEEGCDACGSTANPPASQENGPEVIPEVIVEPASSPGRSGGASIGEPPLIPLFHGPPHLDFTNESVSPPPSSGAPSSWNTPSSGAHAPLSPLSPFLGVQRGELLTAEDRSTRLAAENELAKAYGQKAVITTEISSISAAEMVAREMQKTPLPSLPQYWNAYQYGLSLRAHQARGIWSKMGTLGESSNV